MLSTHAHPLATARPGAAGAPSPRVRELLRQGAEIALQAPPQWIDEIDQASQAADAGQSFAEDPVLRAASRRATLASLVHWAAANVADPGAPVPPHLTPDMLDNARERVRRGAVDTLFKASRAGENAAWQRWMDIAFGLTAEPAELRELLDLSSRSIRAFMDANLDGIAAFIKAEQEGWARGTPVDRRALVERVLEGVEPATPMASQALNYALEQRHQGALIWSEQGGPGADALERAAQALARCARAPQLLPVAASAGTLWAWASGSRTVDLAQLRQALQGLPGVRIALGSAAAGIDGFRRTHQEALAAQRVLGRVHSSARVISFDQVRLVALVTRDAEACAQFVEHALGRLATADPGLARALWMFLRAGSNATQAARQLHVHRNTLLRRLAQAQELLPRPLSHNLVHVAAALQVLHWDSGD
ncbi:PucR family transcriptional regulator [Comamonas endophytica]|uniref:Helix-turn-helix domain-containing protein n=1 Tax=Comamonas endophytica TaxID=2949090 RepID=A0ABY6G9Q7_9BURK|nr:MULTISPECIES: helix-turn-helix domain-containing protein [unclassified Acidovorax]MCD2514549.1 helix-turn-helix domain-containing protein [Acidovorax sp. D4N7]UYG51127.1 helix-turn-helix domain-containing protein [Acidovorax sp. 5MLIR]